MSIKTERVNAELKKQIGSIISENLSDPRVKGLVSVVKVDCDGELDQAKVYLSILGADGEEADAVKAIQSAEGFVKSILKGRVRIRAIPRLKFILDDSISYGVKISQILSEINHGESGNNE